MTLGGWVRDYLYIPMGGNRCGEWVKMRNLFASMLIIGLWHGAGWTFVLWGGYHGILLVINHLWRRFGIRLPDFINWFMTFVCVVLCWVFFRAENVAQACSIVISMTDIYNLGLPDKGTVYNHAGFLADYSIVFSPWLFKDSLPKIFITLSVVMTAVLLVPNPLKLLENKLLFRHAWLPILLGMLAGLSLLLVNIGNSEFLYFQF